MKGPATTFEPSDNPFKTIYVDITHRCQMACSNCYLPNRNIPDMNLDSLTDLLKKLPHKTDIRLIGGEPTLRNDLPEVIEKIAEAGHRPMLITNGLKLSDLNYCKTLKDAGLEYAQISLNGFNDDKIYKIIDQMNCADQKMAAVSNCEQVSIGISLSAIIVKNLNGHLIEEMISFARDKIKKSARINFRNVGDLGRSMTGKIDNYTFHDLVEIIAQSVKAPVSEILKHRTRDNQLRYPLKTGPKRSDVIWIKVTDWENYPMNIMTAEDVETYAIKGRVTEDFKLAPFFDHVKENQFGY